MEACIDTFSSVFGGGGGAAVEYRNPSRNASSPFTHQTFENSQFSNGGGHYSHHPHPHHQPQMQVPSSQSNSGIAMFQNSNDDYHHIQAMSWTDRSLLNSSTNNKICDDGGGGTTTATLAENHHHHHHHLPHHPHHNHQSQSFHPIHPFGPPPPGANDGVSAAFNLQQLHQGICSVGSVPSWQQPYKFTNSNDCALPSVPTNEDGNDMKRSSISMPLSMSRDPNTNTTTTAATTPTTQQSNNFLNINHPCSSTTNGDGDDDDDSQQRFLDHVLNNMQCSTPNNTEHVNTVKNTISSGVTDNNYGASLNNSSEIPPQLNFSSAHLNNGCQNNISRSPQHSPLPPPCSSSYAVSAADANTTSSLGGGGNPSEELTTDL